MSSESNGKWVTSAAGTHEGHQPVEFRYPWRLTGKELLLEMEDEKGTPAIYALEPFASNPKPQLLIRGGRRPVWNHRRTLFAYFRGKWRVWIARRDGYTFDLQWPMTIPDMPRADDPPVYWTYAGNFYCVGNNSRFGTYAESDFCNEPLPDNVDWRKWRSKYAGAGLGPWLRLDQPVDPITLKAFPWRMVSVVRSKSFSPDDQYVAVELSPASPMDLLRAQSKIYIYRNPTKVPLLPPEEEERLARQTRHLGGPRVEPERRLTTSGDGVAELNPLWSPDGCWIAFTVVHPKAGYMAAAVARPDGTGYTELLLSVPEPKSLPKTWQPVRPLLSHREGMLEYSGGPIPRWGSPCDSPVGWTDDGRYLIIRGAAATWKIAKYEHGGWWLRAQSPPFGLLMHSPEDGWAAIGPKGEGGYPVCFASSSLGIIPFYRISDADCKLTEWWVPEGLTLTWADW
jgi:hypothetical protein